jgi:hypothetical protein
MLGLRRVPLVRQRSIHGGRRRRPEGALAADRLIERRDVWSAISGAILAITIGALALK